MYCGSFVHSKRQKGAVNLSHSKELLQKVKNLPMSPGVYLMKDASATIIYVGKSKCLRHRVPSYFQPPHRLNIKTARLAEKIRDFDTIITQNETEALILENELIKRHKPRYNILLKDSKTYPYIKISYENSFPKISMVRNRTNDKAKYFGPYTSASIANENIKTVQKLFGIAACSKDFVYQKQICRPCLDSHIGLCCAPCSGKISPEQYSMLFKNAESFLKGDTDNLVLQLEAQMNDYAEKLMFESAARARDAINAIKRLSEKQKIVSSPDYECDVFGVYTDGAQCCVAILFVRGGKVIDKEQIFFTQNELADEYALSDLLERYYVKCSCIPKNIFVSFEIDQNEQQRISDVLGIIANCKINLITPQRGQNKALCDLADTNAKESALQREKLFSKDERLLVKIAQLLQLESLPVRIEAYDVSNNGANDIYCGMIVLENSQFKKSHYRSFAIKSVINGADDYLSMKEALSRRLSYLENNDNSNASFGSLPDLILLDGGKGHVNEIKKLCYEKNLPIAVFGMVKDDFHKTRTLTDGINEIGIAADNSVFSFFYKIQEEVHRFTFSKMDNSRRKSVKKSQLENIDGIGKQKAKILLTHFRSVSAIKNATVQQLCDVKGISKTNAQNIFDYYNKK